MTQFNDQVSNAHIADLRKHEEEKLMQALAPQYGIDYIDLRGYTINPDALIVLDEKTARAAEVAVFDMRGQILSVGIHKPNAPYTSEIIQILQRKGYQIVAYLISSASLEHAHVRYADRKNTTASKRGILDINPDDIKKRSEHIDSPKAGG